MSFESPNILSVPESFDHMNDEQVESLYHSLMAAERYAEAERTGLECARREEAKHHKADDEDRLPDWVADSSERVAFREESRTGVHPEELNDR